MKDESKYYKWLLLVLLAGALFFHQADRALFGLLTIPIQRDLGLTDIQIGWINTILSWTLAGMAFIAGPVGDRFSRKWIITISLMAWSLMTFMMGFVNSFIAVMFFRSIATGVGESFYGPCYPPLIAAYHTKTRSLALSIQQGFLYFALMSSGILSAWALGVFGGWRQVFMAFGVAGLLLGVLFIFILRNTPTTSPNPSSPSFFSGFKFFFRTPSAICAMVGFVAIVFVNNAYLFWAPKFMAEKFGVSVGEAGTQTMLYHHLFAFAAIVIGGIITDRMVKKYPRFRLALQILALLGGAPCLFAVGMVPSAVAFVVMSSAYGIFRGAFEVNTHASLFDVVPAEYRSTATGIFILFAFFVGGLSGIVMGALSEHYGVRGFEYGFMLMGAAYVIAALTMMISFFFTFKKDRIQE